MGYQLQRFLQIGVVAEFRFEEPIDAVGIADHVVIHDYIVEQRQFPVPLVQRYVNGTLAQFQIGIFEFEVAEHVRTEERYRRVTRTADVEFNRLFLLSLGRRWYQLQIADTAEVLGHWQFAQPQIIPAAELIQIDAQHPGFIGSHQGFTEEDAIVIGLQELRRCIRQLVTDGGSGDLMFGGDDGLLLLFRQFDTGEEADVDALREELGQLALTVASAMFTDTIGTATTEGSDQQHFLIQIGADVFLSQHYSLTLVHDFAAIVVLAHLLADDVRHQCRFGTAASRIDLGHWLHRQS